VRVYKLSFIAYGFFHMYALRMSVINKEATYLLIAHNALVHGATLMQTYKLQTKALHASSKITTVYSLSRIYFTFLQSYSYINICGIFSIAHRTIN